MSTQLGNKKIMARNIQYYMDLHNKTRKDMCQALGVKYTTFTDWVNANTYPRIDKIERMANYFNIEKSDLIEDHDLVADGSKAPFRLGDPNLEGLTNISRPAAHGIPILGTICAGNGVFCEENYAGMFFVDQSIKADVCLNIRGDSMIEAGIADKDIAFIRRVYDYENGKIYAVRINSDTEAVLKKAYFKNDGCIVLAPCNSGYEPMIERMENVSIIGECVGIYRDMI